MLTRVFVKHILYKHLSQPAAIWKDKYYVLNNVCRGKSKFEVMKVDLAGKLDELSALAEYSLKEKDFYVCLLYTSIAMSFGGVLIHLCFLLQEAKA